MRALLGARQDIERALLVHAEFEGEPARILSSTGQTFAGRPQETGTGTAAPAKALPKRAPPSRWPCANRPDKVGADVHVEGCSARLQCGHVLEFKRVGLKADATKNLSLLVVSRTFFRRCGFDFRRFHKADRLKSVLPMTQNLPWPIRIAQRRGGDRRSVRTAVL